MKALIIEDEVQAQNELRRLLKNLRPDINVIGAVGSIEDTVQWLENNEEPDIVFMDIQLSDGLSFEIFDQVELTAPVIFTTAFDEYAIRAFEQNSIDYLLKPIEEQNLARALKKLDGLSKKLGGGPSVSREVIGTLLTGRRDYKSRFLIKTGETYRYLPVEAVAYFYSSAEVTFIVTNEKKKFAVEYTLDQLTGLINPVDFFRVSRKYIAGIKSVSEVRKHFNSRLKLILVPEPQDEILISRKRVPEFLNWLEK